MSILGMLNIPGGYSLGKGDFSKMEQEIGKYEKDVALKALNKNYEEEVRQTMLDSGKTQAEYEAWGKMDVTERQKEENRVGIDASFDAAWQKRSSGNRYDSLSCHAALVGKFTRKPVLLVVYSKKCGTCDRTPDGEDPPEHVCPCNVDCSSKAMEPKAGLQLLTELWYDHGSYVNIIVMDDDSSTEAKCKQNVRPIKSDKGELPKEIPEPKFYADPNHRIKLIGKKVYKLAAMPKSKSIMTKADAMRIKRNMGYFVRRSRTKTFDEFKRDSNTVLKHHFNDHQYCDAHWCPVLKAKANNTEPKGIYRDLNNEADKKLHDQIWDEISVYFSDEMLQQLHHTMDSQVNESINRVMTKYAPKDRTYCTTMALDYRLHLAVGAYIMGWEDFYTAVFKKLGIEMTKNTLSFFQKKDKRTKRLHLYYQSTAVKRRRAAIVNAKIKKLVEQDRKAQKAGNDYGTGIRVASKDLPSEEEQLKPRASKRPRRSGPTKHATVAPKECKRCSRWDHQRTSSKLCTHNKNYDEASGDESYKEWVNAKMLSNELTEQKVGSVPWAELLATVGKVSLAEEIIRYLRESCLEFLIF